MKLALAAGVSVLAGPPPELPVTPPELLTTLAGPLPFGHLGANGLSSVEADELPRPALAGETT